MMNNPHFVVIKDEFLKGIYRMSKEQAFAQAEKNALKDNRLWHVIEVIADVERVSEVKVTELTKKEPYLNYSHLEEANRVPIVDGYFKNSTRFDDNGIITK